MAQWSDSIRKIPLQMVGGNTFGHYPKISSEQTWNMIISDGWMVNFAGYNVVSAVDPTGFGRGIYTSTNLNLMIFVIDNNVYVATAGLAINKVNSLATYTGTVYITENNAGQIGICDRQNIYIYTPNASTFNTLTPKNLGFTPGYISFQDTYFISVDLNSSQWFLSAPNNGNSWPSGAQNVGTFQTSADRPIAAIKIPGKGNLLFVFGSKVTEAWFDTGSPLFPYQRNSYFNIDYGCLSAATIAVNNTMVCWLAANDKSGPFIMVSEGSDATKLSNDGIDFALQSLINPADSFGFFFQQDGHLIYVIVFPTDNVSYCYDFNTQKFFTLTDQAGNVFIAQRVTRFNENYYFVSNQNGNLYEMGTQFYDYAGQEIPRVRIVKPIRLPDASRIIIDNINFTIMQGMPSYRDVLPSAPYTATNPPNEYLPQRIDFSMSKNGGQTYSSAFSKTLNMPFNYPNRMNLWRLGAANDFYFQMRFWGFTKFMFTDGECNYHQ